MSYLEFLEAVIERGIAGAKRSYRAAYQRYKLEGSIAGFEACRGKQPYELKKLLAEAGAQLVKLQAVAFDPRLGDPEKPANVKSENEKAFERQRTFHAEVEWTCNCVSAVLVNEGIVPIMTPTARGVLNANEILTGRYVPVSKRGGVKLPASPVDVQSNVKEASSWQFPPQDA